MKTKSILSMIFALLPFSSVANVESRTGRDWIQTVSGHSASWKKYDELNLPSGEIFIGDPSWGDDYHLHGARAVPVSKLDVWLFVSNEKNTDENLVHTVWLEASATTPTKVVGAIDFGMDSAYFAIGDLTTGRDLANMRNLDLSQYADCFEFFLPHIQNYGFMGLWLNVPPKNQPVLAIETKNDGGLRAVWTEDDKGAFSGILIDITGRVTDQLFLDKLLEHND
jgi:hypothetical protein